MMNIPVKDVLLDEPVRKNVLKVVLPVQSDKCPKVNEAHQSPSICHSLAALGDFPTLYFLLLSFERLKQCLVN